MLTIFLVVSMLTFQVFGLDVIPVPDKSLPSPTKMSLTPGDLKVFAGHALNLVQAKCPTVNSTTIFELNKFIAKMIAQDTNPVPGDDEAFRGVLKSLTHCTKVTEVKVDTENIAVDTIIESDEVPEIFFFARGDGDVIELTPESGELEMDKDMGKRKVEDDPVNVNKVQVPLVAEIDEPIEAPVEVTTPAQPRNQFVAWISSVLSSVREYFQDWFTTRRSRREAGPEPEDIRTTVDHRRTIASMSKDPTTAFTLLFNEVCRIYCDKCRGPNQSRAEFKFAANQILKHLFKIVPEDRLTLATKHHLTPEFMQAVLDCE